MIYSRFKYVKCVVLDVDGVLTDGSILVTDDGNQLRTFNVKDGYAIQYAVKQGLDVFVITGGKSEGVNKRFTGLGVKETYLGVSDKWTLLKELLIKYDYSTSEVLFIGDDMPDYECMQNVAISVAPADAIEDIKKISHIVSKCSGGQGVVREMIEKVLRLQDKWHSDVLIKSM